MTLGMSTTTTTTTTTTALRLTRPYHATTTTDLRGLTINYCTNALRGLTLILLLSCEGLHCGVLCCLTILLITNDCCILQDYYKTLRH